MIKGIVLLVDDDNMLLRLMSRSFEKAGYRALCARDGKDALAKMEVLKPDIIISDINMPNMDGFSLFAELQRSEETASIPFIFLTERTALQDRLRGLEMGCTDYLPKPLDPRELVLRAGMTIQRANARAGRSEAFRGRLEDLSPAALVRVICRSGQSCEISLHSGGRSGKLFLRDSQIIDAELEDALPLDAAIELLNWEEGEFEVEFREISNPARISLGVDAPQEEVPAGEPTDNAVPPLREPTTQLETGGIPAGIPELQEYLAAPAPGATGADLSSETAQGVTTAQAPAGVEELLKQAATLVMERRYCAAMEILEKVLAIEPGHEQARAALKDLADRIENYKTPSARVTSAAL